MIISKVCSPSSSDELTPTTSNLLIGKTSRVSSIQKIYQGLELVFATACSMAHDRLKSALPKVPLPPPVTSKHRTIDLQDPHTTAPECKARLRHTLACHASLRKCTMRRETFIRIPICRPTCSCADLSVLGATCAAQRSGEKDSLSQKNRTARNFQHLKTRCSLLVSLNDTFTKSSVTTLS